MPLGTHQVRTNIPFGPSSPPALGPFLYLVAVGGRVALFANSETALPSIMAKKPCSSRSFCRNDNRPTGRPLRLQKQPRQDIRPISTKNKRGRQLRRPYISIVPPGCRTKHNKAW